MRFRRLEVAAFAGLLAACAGESPVQPQGSSLAIVTGDHQSATAGTPLADTIVVQLTDPAGKLLAGVPVSFTASDGGSTDVTVDTSDPHGLARATWTLGLPDGAQQLQVSAPGRDPLTVGANATVLHAVAVAVPEQGDTACALSGAGEVRCWQISPVQGPNGPAPSQPALSGQGHTFTRLFPAAQNRVCGIDSAGALLCWTPPGGIPTGVPGLPPVVDASLDTHAGNGRLQGCALTAAGKAYCFSISWSGWQPMPDTAVAMAPAFSFAQVAVGAYNICGVYLSGEAYCWGKNVPGVDSSAGVDWTPGAAWQGLAWPVLGGHRFSSIANMGAAACGAAADDGTAYCWGVLDDPNVYLGSAGYTAAAPTPIVPATATSFSLGAQSSFALTSAGSIYRWGSTPALPGPPRLLQGSAGTPGGMSFTSVAGRIDPCGIAASGAVYCWVLRDQPTTDWYPYAVPAP